MSLAGFWAEAYWRRAYGFRSTEYTTGYHRGQDLAGGFAKEVPALRSGAIVFVGRSSAIGFYIVVDVTGRPGPDRYDIYCHMFDGDARRGGFINAGERIGRLALEHERPGTSWKGAHLHHVVSEFPDAGWSVYRPTVDPRPIILAALATPAGGAGKPFDPEEDDMYTDDDRARDVLAADRAAACYAALFGPANINAPKITWAKPFGEPIGEAYYGLLDVTIATQNNIVKQSAAVAALTEAVRQLAAREPGSSGGVDMNAVQEAARKGAAEALSGLTLRAQ